MDRTDLLSLEHIFHLNRLVTTRHKLLLQEHSLSTLGSQGCPLQDCSQANTSHRYCLHFSAQPVSLPHLTRRAAASHSLAQASAEAGVGVGGKP